LSLERGRGCQIGQGGHTVCHTELGVGVFEMMANGVRAEAEQGRDFSVVFPLLHPMQDFLLAPGEAPGRRLDLTQWTGEGLVQAAEGGHRFHDALKGRHVRLFGGREIAAAPAGQQEQIPERSVAADQGHVFNAQQTVGQYVSI